MSEQTTTTEPKLTSATALLSTGEFATARISHAFGDPVVEIVDTTRPSSVSEVDGRGLCVWLLQSKAKVWFRIERGGLAADVKEGPYGETWRPIDNVESCGLVEHRGRWVS